MPKNVQLPDGSVVEFPDNMPDDQISAAIRKHTEGQKGFAQSFAETSGLSALAHPIDTIMGIPASIKQMATDTVANAKQGVADYQKEGLSETTRRDFGRAVPIVGPVLAQAQAQHDAGNNAGMAGTLAGTVAGFAAPEALSGIKPAAVLDKAAPAIRSAGEAAQESAGGIVNRATGTLKSDFKRGANPGRGYLAEGGGVATSMKDLAEKSAAIKQDVGQRIGQMYQQADATGKLIPVQDVADALGQPMTDAYKAAKRVRGLKEELDFHMKSFDDDFQKATAQGGFTPSQVWELKQDIADSTSWGDATQMGMKRIKQQQAGALAGVLNQNIPELAQANQSYMDLIKMAGRAQERADTGSRPLTAHAWDIGSMVAGGAVGDGMHGGMGAAAGLAAAKIARSVPGRTAAAAGLYNVGEGLTSIADRIDQLRSAAKNAAKPGVSNPVEQQVAASTPKSNAAATQAIIQSLQAVQKLRGNREQ